MKILRCSLVIFLLVMCVVLGLQTPALALVDGGNPDPASSIQPYLDRVKSRVTEFRLNNGMKFIVLERHQAPVVSFVTYADVGGVDEPVGKTGVAHFLEHLAFKGTSRIGTSNWEAEKVLLDRLDQLDAEIRQAIATGQDPKNLQAEFAQTEAEADKYIKINEYSKIISQAGGVGMNATTSTDATNYFYSLPANKIELWFSLESERFLDPVFREFRKEKDVVLEEMRLSRENSPIGKLFDSFKEQAFATHPYKHPVIGYEEDLRNLTRQDIQDFFKTYYGPSNLTVGIVGDVDPQQVKQLAASYFGRYVAGSTTPVVNTVEPVQAAAKNFTLELDNQPVYMEGYHRPAIDHPDHAVYTVIAKLMSDGRRSRLYDQLVDKQKIALSARGFNGYPGNKFPNLLVFYAFPTPGTSLEKIETALRAEITKLQQEPVTPAELERVKRQFKVEILDSLGFDWYMASALVEAEVKLGSWRKLFEEIDRVDAVTASDIQRVAQAAFIETNRTVGKLITKN
jgi:predicted Zn-dependent peptidase